ncbi:MAG: response regulator [Gemmatimonas sp.]|uniref:response regulator n=1 Tax=Gemmatimonas sp. TaxID=1962908 RepID=UPI00391F9CDC
MFVEMHDTGASMDVETRQRMFEPFFSTKFTGLGLTATIGIMRSHGGAIRVYSKVGSGTSVTLLFPSSTTLPPRGTPDDARSEGAGHVLGVDDEESVRSVAAALLRRRGFTVTEGRDGLDAVSVFGAAPSQSSLVLLDLTMPNMNGEETLRALRHIRSDLNVLLMSGYNEQDVARMFAGRERSGFLQKPFTAGELYEAVGAAVRLG